MTTKTISVAQFRLLANRRKDVRTSVRTWVQANMPCVPLAMLTPLTLERFEPCPHPASVVHELDIFRRECPVCGDEKFYVSRPDESVLCCAVELLAVQDGCDFEEETVIVVHTPPRHKKHVSIIDHLASVDDLPTHNFGALDIVRCDEKVMSVCVFDNHYGAEEAASDLNRYLYANAHGFPWANSQVYVPHHRIELADLDAAGFLVYDFYPYSQSCGGYRVCGIDGGGYDMFYEHIVRLYAYHHCTTQAIVVLDGIHHTITP